MKNMALTDLVLVRPRSFPHADAIALAAGADDILASARIVTTVAEAIADCGFIAGTTSRPRSYYWEFTTPRDVAGRIVGLAEENRAALLFGSERYGLATEDLNHCNVLVRIPANPEYCSLNLAMSVQLLAYEIFMAREQPQSHTQLELALAASGDVEHFYAHLHAGAERNRFRRPYRAPDGALAPSVQPRAARPQRTQHHARHLERGAGPARSGGSAQMNRPVYLDHAATTPVDPRVAAAMAQCLTAEGAFGNPASASHDFGDCRARRWSRRRGRRWRQAWAPRRRRSFGLRAPPKRTIWRFSASPSITATRGRHIVTARTEHKAVLDPCRELERRGWRVTYLAPDQRRPGPSGAGRRRIAGGYRAGVHHARQQRNRRHPRHRGHCSDLRAAWRRAAARGCGAERRQARHRFCGSRRRPDVAVGAQGVRPQRRGRAAGVARRRPPRAAGARAA